MKKEKVYTLTILYDGQLCDSFVYTSYEKAYKAMGANLGDELWDTLTNMYGVTEDDLDPDAEDVTQMLEAAEDHDIPYNLTANDAYFGRWEYFITDAELQ